MTSPSAPSNQPTSSRRQLRERARPAGLAALALLVGALAPACHVTPDPPQRYVEVLYRGTLEEVQPNDVVVPPLLNTAGEPQVPEGVLREAFVRNLAKRRYAPLALEYVDRQVIEAAYAPGSLGEQAVLQVEVRRWDMSRFTSHAVIEVEIEAWMLDAGQPGRAELWGGRTVRSLDLSVDTARFASTRLLFESVCDELAADLLEAMPARAAQP